MPKTQKMKDDLREDFEISRAWKRAYLEKRERERKSHLRKSAPP
jgi:hypothetical protein